MDRPTTSSRADFYTTDPQSTLLSPDPEARGRQRRRDPLHPYALPRTHNPSRESSTLRGRCRHRSASRLNTHLGAALSKTSSRHRGDSPGREKRRLLAGAVVAVVGGGGRRRRSRSRSRGRRSCGGRMVVPEVLVVSPGVGGVMGQWSRRQRTQSRSRRQHGLEGAYASVALAGRPTLGFEGWVAEDGDANGKD